VKYIADAGALIALMNEDDQHHGWAVATLPRLARPWLVCEAVLAEAAAMTGQPLALAQEVTAGELKLAFDLEGQLVPVVRLLERYADREMDLADACVVRMSELHPRSTVITVDRRDFTAYRRNQREVLPFIAPEV
jgi:uncharacterized protein